MSVLKALEYEREVDRMLRNMEEDIWNQSRIQRLLHDLQVVEADEALQRELLKAAGVPSVLIFKPEVPSVDLEAKRVLEDAQREVDRLESLKKPCEEAVTQTFTFRRKLEP